MVKKMIDDRRIIIDTRERKPFKILNSIKKTLHTGDYSIEFYDTEVSVERKSIGDAISSVTSGRKRFEKEWIRAKTELQRFFVVIEGTPDMITKEIVKLGTKLKKKRIKYNVKRTIGTVVNTYLSWSVKYDVPVYFCKNIAEARYITVKLLNKYVDYREADCLFSKKRELKEK